MAEETTRKLVLIETLPETNQERWQFGEDMILMRTERKDGSKPVYWTAHPKNAPDYALYTYLNADNCERLEKERAAVGDAT